MPSIPGFWSNISETCQSNCNADSEEDDGRIVEKYAQKIREGGSRTNTPLSVSEQNSCQVSHASHQTSADSGH